VQNQTIVQSVFYQILGKIFEKILSNRLFEFVQDKHILPPEQYGFKRHTSTNHALLNLITNIETHTNNVQNGGTSAVLLDLKAAYDSVNHSYLIQELKKYNFPSKLVNIISSFLSNRESSTRIITVDGEHVISDPLPFNRGVPQGSPISPILFNIYIAQMSLYINNLNGYLNSSNPVIIATAKQHYPHILLKVNHQFYADDLIIWVNGQDKKLISHRIQESLNYINHIFKSLELRTNPKKCQSIGFYKPERNLNNNPRKYHNLQYKLDNVDIPIDDKPRYLGILLDPQLSFKHHVKKVVNESNRRLYVLSRLSNTNKGVGTRILRIAYQGFVRPIFDYGSSIWLLPLINSNHHTINSLINFDLKAKRLILGCLKTTPRESLHVQTSIPPLHLRIKRLAIHFCIRSLHHHQQEWIKLANTSFPKSTINQIISLAADSKSIDSSPFTLIPQQVHHNINNHINNNNNYLQSIQK
jgi:hypothetical protein